MAESWSFHRLQLCMRHSQLQNDLSGESKLPPEGKIDFLWLYPGQAGTAKFLLQAFYKGESQEKTLLQRLEEAGMFAFSPAHVMLGGSGFFFSFLQIHR